MQNCMSISKLMNICAKSSIRRTDSDIQYKIKSGIEQESIQTKKEPIQMEQKILRKKVEVKQDDVRRKAQIIGRPHFYSTKNQS